MSLVKSGVTWIRHTFSWSNSQASWRERLIGLAFFLVAIGLIFLSIRVQAWQAAIAWGVYLIALAVCSRQGWLRLFGPVLFYDMLVTARRSRYVIMRLLYALLLLFVLCSLFLSVQSNARRGEPSVMMFLMPVGIVVLMLSQLGLIGLLRVVTSRVGRYIIFGLLAAGVMIFVTGVILVDLLDQPNNLQNQNDVGRQSAQMAEIFFFVFMLVQMTMIVLLTPAYVAGAIAEEKDRKTIEFLLATDLTNREIILSKLLSRLANLTLFLLTGLPILSILQFIGGVDPQLMIASFVGTGLTMLGIASLSILLSTLFKRPRDAIGMTYLTLIAYMSIATTGMAMAQGRVWWMATEVWFNDDYSILGIPLWHSPAAPTLADVSQVLNAGNPIAAGIDITMAINQVNRAMGRTTLAAELPSIVQRFAWFHLPLSLICIIWSIVRIRAIALTQTVGGTTAKVRWWQRYRPPVGELPMLWKESHIEGGMKLNWIAFIVIVLLVLVTLGSGLLVLGAHLWDNMIGFNNWHRLRDNMNNWFRIAGTGVAMLMILHIAVRASTSISTERERDTFDALITTPMSCEAMLGAKLLGTLMSLRMGWLWFGSMMAIAILSGGLHLLAVPLVLMAWFVYAVSFTMVGMWFSMACKSSMRATVLTVITSLFVGGGHWLVMSLCFYIPVSMVMRNGGQGDFLTYMAQFEAGMTPPAVLFICAYSWEDLAVNFNRHDKLGELVVFSLIGLFLWALACVILWYGVLVPKFRQLTRREELIYR